MGNRVSQTPQVRAARSEQVHNATAAAAAQVRAQAAALAAPPALTVMAASTSSIIPQQQAAQVEVARMTMDLAARQLERGDRPLTKADLVAILARLHNVQLHDAAALMLYQSLSVGELCARIRLSTLVPAAQPVLATAPSAPMQLPSAPVLPLPLPLPFPQPQPASLEWHKDDNDDNPI